MRRVTGPWNAAALPEIMAGALQEGKRGVPVLFHEGRAAGQQPGSAAGARGGGTAEARARPNVEVNRRAEGASELNRRLGAVDKGAAALDRCGVAGDYGRDLAGRQERRKASSMCPNVPRRPSSRQPGSVAGARGGGAAEARARPNVEVNRRAEGTSGLNRRLGAGGKGAVALECCGVAGDCGRCLAGKQERWNASAMCLNVPRRPATG